MTGSLNLASHRIDYGFAVERKGNSQGWVKQVHFADFLEVTDPQATPLATIPADAVLTSLKQKEIYVYTADCLPVLLAGETRQGHATVAAIHSGWRGTMRGIVPKVLAAWPAPIDKTRVFIGPALGPCHFEVKNDFVEEFGSHYPQVSEYLVRESGKMVFRMTDFVCAEQLGALPAKNIDRSANVCTFCGKNSDGGELPSYRRNKGTDPQLRGWIRIN